LTRRHRQQTHIRGGGIRPTTSRVLSALFSMFGPEGVEGLAMLDLYAGVGGFGLEALRRGAARLVMVEKSRNRCEQLKQEVVRLSAEARGPEAAVAEVVCGDVLRSIPKLLGPFDVVFADPPYADNPFAALAEELESNRLLSPGGTVLLEHFRKTVLPDALGSLRLVTRRHYGDAAISVYRMGAVLEPRSGAGPGKGA
jgi:16S rRNA (guanine966-N2)-methyltransferase